MYNRNVERTELEARFANAVEAYAFYVHSWAQRKGFWDEDRNFGELIALIHSELSEALEAMRTGNPPDKHVPTRDSLAVELADAVVRILDLCAAYEIDIGHTIVDKMNVNEGRPYKHGKDF